jgi:2-oxoglutarate dehydrogenase E2 component (dihydrolipoamide succinyltransferase)
MAYLSLTYDHRLVDGADAARYLSAVPTRLEQGFTADDLGIPADRERHQPVEVKP